MRASNRTILIISATILFTTIYAHPGHAQSPDVPKSMSLQGIVTDSEGIPVADGPHNVTFRIWNDPVATAGSNERWNSGTVSVTTSDGLFTVQLGASPMPPLESFEFIDSNLWLGITVDPDPELSPRIKLATNAYGFLSRFAINALTADSANVAEFLNTPGATSGQVLGWDGASWVPQSIDDVYVNESGDTVTGSLAVTGNFSAGTDSVEAPITLRTQDNWYWGAGNGLGDVRIGDGVRGLSIGVATIDGAVRLWPSGGLERLMLSTPTSGDQLVILGATNKVYTGSDFSVGTIFSNAPLHVGSDNKWRWDIDNGKGDFYIGDITKGFSIGVATEGGGNGTVRMWSSGGTSEDIRFGSPSAGDILSIGGNGITTIRNKLFITDSASNALRFVFDPQPNYPNVTFWGRDNQVKVTIDAGFSIDTAGHIWVYNPDEAGTVNLWGGSSLTGGQVSVFSPSGSPGVTLSGGSTGTGRVEVSNSVGSVVTRLLGLPGDFSAQFPDGAINPDEILAEPGITSENNSSGLTLNSANMTDLETVTITTPRDGYIVLEGKCYVTTSGTTGVNQGFIQIDEGAGGSESFPYYTQFGLGSHASTAANRFPIYVTRVYQKVAGTYTFRLEGLAHSANGAGAFTQSWDHILTATYYPTSYGTVTSVIAQSETGEFESVATSTVQRPDDQGQLQQHIVHTVDLRDLELKAARARAVLERAERELLEAQMQQPIAPILLRQNPR